MSITEADLRALHARLIEASRQAGMSTQDLNLALYVCTHGSLLGLADKYEPGDPFADLLRQAAYTISILVDMFVKEPA